MTNPIYFDIEEFERSDGKKRAHVFFTDAPHEVIARATLPEGVTANDVFNRLCETMPDTGSVFVWTDCGLAAGFRDAIEYLETKAHDEE